MGDVLTLFLPIMILAVTRRRDRLWRDDSVLLAKHRHVPSSPARRSRFTRRRDRRRRDESFLLAQQHDEPLSLRTTARPAAAR